MAVCNKETKSCIEQQLFRCLKLITKYEWLHSTLLHDFFVENHWQSIPEGWRQALHDLTPTGLSNFLNYWDRNNDNHLQNGVILPLELLALKSCVSQFSVSRKPVQNVYEALNLLNLPADKIHDIAGNN